MTRDGNSSVCGFVVTVHPHPTPWMKTFVVVLIALSTGSLTSMAQTYAFLTWAGSPAPGFADGVGFTARFNGPRDVAVDDDGIVFVADTGNHVIRRIAPDGTVTTFAGASREAGAADGPG